MDGTNWIPVSWVVLHLSGLIAAWAVRQEIRGGGRTVATGGFLACLPLVGLATVLGEFYCLSLWPLSAATLGTMIVTAVIDFGPSDSEYSAGDSV